MRRYINKNIKFKISIDIIHVVILSVLNAALHEITVRKAKR